MSERHKPCGADTCCFTDDKEYVESLRAQLKAVEAERDRLAERLRTAVLIATGDLDLHRLPTTEQVNVLITAMELMHKENLRIAGEESK